MDLHGGTQPHALISTEFGGGARRHDDETQQRMMLEAQVGGGRGEGCEGVNSRGEGPEREATERRGGHERGLGSRRGREGSRGEGGQHTASTHDTAHTADASASLPSTRTRSSGERERHNEQGYDSAAACIRTRSHTNDQLRMIVGMAHAEDVDRAARTSQPATPTTPQPQRLMFCGKV